MPTLPQNKDRRVQFDLLPERIAEMDQVMIYCDLRTRKDLFDNAMTLFEWAVEEVRKGNKIASYNRDTDHVEVVRFPVLENAARKAQTTKTLAVVPTSDGGSDDATQATNASRVSQKIGLVHS
jgi:hypothetical protein